MERGQGIVQIGEYGKRVGETHGRAELSDHEVELVRELAEQGMPLDEIAKKMEVAKRYIYKLVNYERRASLVVKVKRHPPKPAPLAPKPKPEAETGLFALIKQALSGASSQNPVPEDGLLKLGKPEEVRKALDALHQGRAVNWCSITRNGIQSTVWWPTGVIGKFMSPAELNSRDRMRHREKNVQQKTATQPREKVMSQEKQTGIGKLALSLIENNPGIQFRTLLDEVRKTHPNAEANNLSQALFPLKKAQKVRMEGKGRAVTYFPAVAPAALETAAPLAPAETNVPPRPAPIQVPAPTDPQPKEDNLSLMVDDDNYLHVGFQTDAFTLNPQQVMRLKRFLSRFLLEAA